MRKYVLRVSLLSAACSIFLVLPAFASSLGGGTVTASSMNIRTAADADAPVLTVAPSGAAAIVTAQSNGWYGVYYHGCAGYAAIDDLEYTGELVYAFGNGTVNADGVRLRSGPSLTSPVQTYCHLGQVLSVTGVHGAWYRVTLAKTEAYIHSNYLDMVSRAEPAAGIVSAEPDVASNVTADAGVAVTIPISNCAAGEYSSAGERIVQTALQYLGVPYVWGGTSPSGFDCSGLVYYVYQQNGYAVNRTAESLYSNGVFVDRANLQIGDILCFYSTPGGPYIGHTGIYIGNGKMIHASSSQNAIATADLATEYFSARYCGARRVAA